MCSPIVYHQIELRLSTPDYNFAINPCDIGFKITLTEICIVLNFIEVLNKVVSPSQGINAMKTECIEKPEKSLFS